MGKNKKMNVKNVVIGVIAVIFVIGLLSAVLYGCSSNDSNASDTSNTASSAAAATGSITVIAREEGSGTRDAFTELMEVTDSDGNDATVETAELTNSTSVMMSTVSGNEKAIGYVSLGSLSSDVKAVKLDGVEASTETVKDGSYKLQRPFNIAYIDGELSEVAQDFVKYITSKQGADVINEEGYIGMEATEDYTASGFKGTVTLAGSTSVAPVMNVLADKYKEMNPDVTIEIQESGSSAGIESAIQGAVEIAMSSRELKDDEAKTLTPTTIALDGIAVIVNNNNSIDDLTSEQVKNIFLGDVTTWDEVSK